MTQASHLRAQRAPVALAGQWPARVETTYIDLVSLARFAVMAPSIINAAGAPAALQPQSKLLLLAGL